MSVREKYNTTVREFRRAESLPERLSIWRRAWAWTIEKSRNSTAVFGIFLIPLYFIVIGIWKFEKCGGEGGSLNIPMWLIIVGSLIFVCALYLPFRRIAKCKAREARMTPRDDPLTEEEIARYFPLKMNRVSNFAFLCLCGCLPTLAIWTFRLDPKIPCDPLIYWTAFVTSIIYCVYLTIVLVSCSLCCCIFVACPFLIEKWRNGKEDGGGGVETYTSFANSTSRRLQKFHRQEEISRHFPFHLHRICNFFFMFLCAILPVQAIWLFRMDPSIPCTLIIYWTVFVISVIYCFWLASLMLVGLIGFCALIPWPFCKEKWRSDL